MCRGTPKIRRAARLCLKSRRWQRYERRSTRPCQQRWVIKQSRDNQLGLTKEHRVPEGRGRGGPGLWAPKLQGWTERNGAEKQEKEAVKMGLPVLTHHKADRPQEASKTPEEAHRPDKEEKRSDGKKKSKKEKKTKHRSRSDSSDFDSESFSKRRRKDPRDHHGPNPSRSSQSGAGACDSHSGWGLKAEHRTLTPPHQHRRHVTDSSSDGHRAGRGSPAQSYRRRHDSSSDD